MHISFKLLALLTITVSPAAFAETFTLSSNDVSDNEYMSKTHEFNGFGCSGDDLSPHLTWSNAPKGTKSFAITAYDPDAPTGSGWWHWQVINIPAEITEIRKGFGSVNKGVTTIGAKQISNDYGVKGFGGACPPEGHGVHHYHFKVHALSVEKLELPENASGALTGYMINANTIDSASIISLYKRD